MNRLLCLFLVVFCGLGWSVCHASARLPVYVSILPQQYFLERIGGDMVDASVMVMPGASPATYEPTPRQMTKLSRAKGYFAIGVPFERIWLPRIADGDAKLPVLHTDEGIKKRAMESHGHEEEQGHDDHGGTHHGEEGIPDPHVWLSPERVRVIARNSCAGLMRLDPANKAVYESNLAVFLKEIDRVDEGIRNTLAQVPEGKRTFMVFHPSWGYFADQYGLRQVAIESEGKEPGPRELVEIVEHGRELGVSAIFYQPQFSSKSAKVIAKEIGARAVPLDPLSRDWADNLMRAAKSFQEVLR